MGDNRPPGAPASDDQQKRPVDCGKSIALVLIAGVAVLVTGRTVLGVVQ
jgi:hypothetical protein